MTTKLSTERVGDLFAWAYAWRSEDDPSGTDLSGLRASNRAEFDTWLAAHDAEVKADALEAATVRTVELATAAEMEALPDRAAVIDKFGDVLHFRGGLWCSYEAQPMGSEWVARKCGPVTVFYTPEAR
jgi:hypothetical protein